MAKLGEDARKKQPGDTLMGFGAVIAVLAIFGAANAGPGTATGPLLMIIIGLILVTLGYLRRRAFLR